DRQTGRDWKSRPVNCIPYIKPSDAALDHHLLDFGDGLGWVQALRASLCAVHDCMATVEAERIFKIVQTLACCLVAAVDQPTIGLKQNSGAEVTVAVPPVARTGGGAAGAQNALVKTVQFLAVVMALLPFLGRGRRHCLQ